jgi:ABC-type transporter MlaC component
MRFLGLAIFLLWGAAAQAQVTPTARTQGLIEAFKTVKIAPEGGHLDAAEVSTNQRAFTAIDVFFNFPRLVVDALGPHKKKFSAPQFGRFEKDFRELVRTVSYTRSAALVQRAKLEVAAPQAHAAQQWVDMHVALAEQDLETHVTFVWECLAKQWQITDVLFDGASFVKDYQNQFGKIVKKEGVDGLLKRLSTRLAKEQKA